MAGIGFEIRKLLDKNTYFFSASAYIVSGIVSSGPWLFSILGIFLIGIMTSTSKVDDVLVTQFSVTITYLIAFSLIITGPFILIFTRYVADKIFDKTLKHIIPNLLGALLLMSIFSLIIGSTICYFIDSISFTYRIAALLSFVTLCNLWVVMTLLSGIKQYKTLMCLFFIGYSLTVLFSYVLYQILPNGLIIGFYLGQATLLFLLLTLIFRNFPIIWSVDFAFLKIKHLHSHLIFIGLFYNLGIWIDKLLFWFTPHTSEVILPPLRSSIIYDLPIFFSYLTIITGMSVFLIRMETDFVEKCQDFFQCVQKGTLKAIENSRIELSKTIDIGLYDIFKIQLITAILAILFIETFFNWIGISLLYIPLFIVLCIAMIFQMTFLALLNVCFYLEFRWIAVCMTFLFLISNAVLTYLTIQIDVKFYGYGYLLSTMISSIFGYSMIKLQLPSLEYLTFSKAH